MSASLWYFDTSAFVKLLVEEPESKALLEWIRGRQIVSSDLLRTEARRALVSQRPDIRRRCDQLVRSVDLVPLSPKLLDEAGELAVVGLRSLDAIHLVAASSLGTQLAGFVCYDSRLVEAASNLGLNVVAPS